MKIKWRNRGVKIIVKRDGGENLRTCINAQSPRGLKCGFVTIKLPTLLHVTEDKMVNVSSPVITVTNIMINTQFSADSTNYETRRKKSGSLRNVEKTPVGAKVRTGSDITDRKQHERTWRHSKEYSVTSEGVTSTLSTHAMNTAVTSVLGLREHRSD